jgi:uncharacterized membrane protein YfcA
MNPIWITIGAIAGGHLFLHDRCCRRHAYGRLPGADRANGRSGGYQRRQRSQALQHGPDPVLAPGFFYRYAVVERRVAWPVGISFGVGIFIGSIWLGKYVSALLPLQAYKEWLAILVVIMGIQTLRELTPKAMEKRKNIKAMVQKVQRPCPKPKPTGELPMEMGRIEPVKSSLTGLPFQVLGGRVQDQSPAVCYPRSLASVWSPAPFGIGGGFLLVPAMTTLGALPMYVAVPISLIGTCFSSIGAFIGYLMTGYYPDMWLMIAIIIGGFAGGMLGSRAQKMFSEKQLKIVLAINPVLPVLPVLQDRNLDLNHRRGLYGGEPRCPVLPPF